MLYSKAIQRYFGVSKGEKYLYLYKIVGCYDMELNISDKERFDYVSL
jgi:hypothetical protein